MKKSRIVGFALTLASTLVVGSAMGQDVKGGTDFVKVGATDGAATNKKALVTAGKSTGFYALPDASFHPGYTASNTPAWNLTTGFTWVWTGAGVTIVKPVGAPANFVELSSATAGVYDVNVKEQAPAAFGGCADATGKDFKLVVFDKPTVAFDAATGRDLTATCGDITAYAVKLNLSATDFVTVKFRIEERPVTINAGTGATVVGAARTTTQVSTNKQAAGATTTPIVGLTSALSGTAFDFDADEANRALVLTLTRDYAVNTGAGDVITLYRFVIDNTDAANLGGINDFVSRKSDHGTQDAVAPAAYTMYDNATAKTLDVYVKRAPKTGPVYHINNNIAK